MLGTIAGLLASSGFGGILGLLGSWLTKREERHTLQMKYDFDVRMAAIRKEEAAAEAAHELAMADKEMERAEVEGRIATGLGELEAFKESLRDANAPTGIRLIDGIKGLMRPLITIYLLMIATALTIKVGQLTGGLTELPKDKLLELYQSIIDEILFLASTTITWWFGSRPSSSRKERGGK